MTKPVPINIGGSWDLFQYYIANAMKCEESDLNLGFTLSTEPKMAKYHSVASEREYEAMQRAVTYELRKQSALLKKKTKKSSQPGAVIKPLAVSIRDMCLATEKKSEAFAPMDLHFSQLQNKYGKCNNHRNKFCLVLKDGMHHFLTVEELRLWAMMMELGGADLNTLPNALNIPPGELVNHPMHGATSGSRQPSPSMVIGGPTPQPNALGLNSDLPVFTPHLLPVLNIGGNGGIPDSSLLHSVLSNYIT
ncbi:uncharacterized protein EI90DRAFT_3016920 [Cantharellus anzutake]|uniref:uncharacterized protein n=1 Tax=Cantharellus anzutake TaxID=1750568 RepID=UPI0019030224|nr:uncharacterized protein EI90DRAFT_3016920 [Cantharellus anzutake]KAF8330199.1 hypothetical protein EI90DRAFT_3016920 [Cantharellus anzutake]